MTVLDVPAVALDTDTLMAQAHVEPASDDAADFERLVAVARRVGRPKAAYVEAFVTERQPDAVRIADVWFESRTLARQLVNVERVFAVLATCGREVDDDCPVRDDILQSYWWDLIKTHLLRAAHARLAEHLKRTFRIEKTASMSPGSGDANVWPIEQQSRLFSLFPEHEAKLGVRLTESCLMVPNKTTSGIVFPTDVDFRTCEVCHRAECPSRRAPFSPEVWDAMQHA